MTPAIDSTAAVAIAPPPPARAEAGAPASSFDRMLLDGVGQVNERLVQADALVRGFALGDDIAPHRVTFALEQAWLSLELAMQVRARLVEAYQDLMKMQL